MFKSFTALFVHRTVCEKHFTEVYSFCRGILADYPGEDFYTHDEVFDDIRQSPFTVKEAAEYLEIAEITLRRWVKAGTIKHKRVGRNIVFDPDELKSFKRSKRSEKE